MKQRSVALSVAAMRPRVTHDVDVLHVPASRSEARLATPVFFQTALVCSEVPHCGQ